MLYSVGEVFTSCLVCFWLLTTHLEHAVSKVNQMFVFSFQALCLAVTNNALLLILCTDLSACEHWYINCVFISICFAIGGVLGDWHCAWQCEYTKLCRNGSANTAIVIVFLKCENRNGI
jgi:hypothetical protein